MSKINDILPALEWFGGRQIAQLAKPSNVAKSDWRKVSVDKYREQIANNLRQFGEAKEQGWNQTMIDRCADVANLSMLLAAKLANDTGIVKV